MIGIRERTLIKDNEITGKYKPAIINHKMYNHPLGFNLYNINNMKFRLVENLIDELNRATEAYDKGKPYMSDHEWDARYYHLVAIEEMQGWASPNSPTQQIHYNVVNELAKVQHNHPMLSLDKTKSLDELNEFCGNRSAFLSLKLDGLTCSLYYANGKLQRAETRGNGVVGEDITHNAFVIPSIPKRISYKEELVVDGEIICLVLTNVDLQLFFDHYDIEDLNFVCGWKFKALEGIFTSYIDKWIAKKNEGTLTRK